MTAQALNDRTADREADRIYSALRARGGRITSPRRAVIGALTGGGEHLDAERLTDLVQRRLPKCSFTTIYRTLAALEDLGVVHHVHFGHGSSIWHLDTDDRPHLVCDSCSRVLHADADDFRTLQRRISTRYGFNLRAHFAVVGRCKSCQTD
jgi:Fur family ferric uptake transcriptional regulator